MSEKRVRLPEPETGAVLYHTDPIIMKWHYEIDYKHSYALDSPFFVGLSKGELKGSACARCEIIFATPRAHCMSCGDLTNWVLLPTSGKIHTFTRCFFGGETFLKETPFTLILVEFEGVDTLFLSRLVGAMDESVEIGMPVKAQFLKNSQFLATDVYFVLAS
ncbi:MAG: Zn-ribbon domain-containing OB-fold protein [Nitrospirae bacterium]|nr:Zn-ribbon domain-containing OB-fold protein [Candidatus Manganitrophaceae bacterium]